ncbi:MAG: Bax inhibitor-1 family protein [Thermoleophilaceae bacterium]
MASDYDTTLPRGGAVGRDEEIVSSQTLFGQVMGLVAITCAFAAVGAYIGRDLNGGVGFGAFIGALALTFGIRYAILRSERLAITLLFGMGLLLGLFIGPIVNEYANANPGVVYQAAGATALFVGGLGAYGYATSRDFSTWARTLFWSLLALIGFGLVTLFVAIPGGNVIYAVLGLVLFGFYTVFDFNRLKRASDMRLAPALAASIFLDIFNIFLFMLSLLGGGRR